MVKTFRNLLLLNQKIDGHELCMEHYVLEYYLVLDNDFGFTFSLIMTRSNFLQDIS